MTNKRAAQVVQAVKFLLDDGQYTEEVEEALDLAIKALENERPRKSNRKPKCTNFSNCGDCVHAEFVWDGVTFRGIRCLKGCK